ncbi:hypothetical protein HX021_17775 [Sphingobacterium sp. N143]|uniref:hypothetical protein n=1 Tax=Sphingobacterium sp. N143 TaxID=2746727 RepID=UPI002575EEB8|nr:hypothetical protein [Sphingobacterium sp. N143]MDM1296138.1 hypothetical protein [Sphingobacterium sp. N143]
MKKGKRLPGALHSTVDGPTSASDLQQAAGRAPETYRKLLAQVPLWRPAKGACWGSRKHHQRTGTKKGKRPARGIAFHCKRPAKSSGSTIGCRKGPRT